MARGAKPTAEETKEFRERAVLAAAVKSGGLEFANELNAKLKLAEAEVLIPTSAAGSTVLASKLANPFLLASNGNLMDLSKGSLKVYDAKGKEVKTERTVTVQIVENGIGTVKTGGVDGVFRPVRGKAEITESQRMAILNNNGVRGPSGLTMSELAAGVGQTFKIPAGSNIPDQFLTKSPLTLGSMNALFDVKKDA